MSNLDLDNLFSFTAEDALAETKSQVKNFNRNGIYKPSVKDEKCKDNNYRALVRFVPFIHDGKVKTTVMRWESYLKDVNDENGIYVVSPKTVGKHCPMRALSYKLYKSDNAIDKENSKKISVYQQWYAIVEVIKDVQHPEYEGKHLIYQFGSKIYEKIENAMKSTDFKDAINPFDFLNARLFEINLKKDDKKKIDGNSGGSVTNYEECGFVEKTAPIHFPVKTEENGEEKIVMTTLGKDIESKKAFVDWIQSEDAPKITEYFYKEWDAETTEKVNTNLASYTSSGYTAPKTAVASAKQSTKTVNDEAENATTTSKKIVVDDDEPEIEDISANADDDDWVNNILNGNN